MGLACLGRLSCDWLSLGLVLFSGWSNLEFDISGIFGNWSFWVVVLNLVVSIELLVWVWYRT